MAILFEKDILPMFVILVIAEFALNKAPPKEASFSLKTIRPPLELSILNADVYVNVSPLLSL